MDESIILSFRVVPNKPESKIVGVSDDGTIRIEIKAPPVEGKANKELIGVLAKIFKLNKSQIVIIKGLSSKNKLIRIDSIDKARMRGILASRFH